MTQTVQDGLARLMQDLSDGGIDGAPREARLILAHALGVEPGRLTLMARDPLPPGATETALASAVRRARGEPMSHILGYREFYGRRFAVDGRVLDPRPETEMLVSKALEAPFARVLDLGVGSGAILLSLLAERPEAHGVGTDLSGEALEVARVNAEALGVAARAEFAQSDWFAQVEGSFDLIVSNPPYIAVDEMAGLQVELGFEPRMALTDEADGLSAYRHIAQGVMGSLAPGGRLMVEIGPTQGEAVAALFRQAGLHGVEVVPDLDGRDRVVLGRRM